MITPYLRKTLRRTATSEVALIRWNDALGSAPHDHGDAHGYVLLLEGRFVERRWSYDGGRLIAVSEATYTAPAVIRCQRGLIHDLRSPDGGLSLHVYHGTAETVRIFDPAEGRVFWVTGETPAYLPIAPHAILESTSWEPAR